MKEKDKSNVRYLIANLIMEAMNNHFIFSITFQIWL
jgi:hypothetical protein